MKENTQLENPINNNNGSLSSNYRSMSSKMGSETVKIIHKNLLENEQITALNLTDNDLDDEGIKLLAPQLEKNKTLLILNLSKNKIGSEGIITLANSLRHSLIHTLYLCENNLGEGSSKAISFLLNNTNVTHLNLYKTGINDQDVQEISKAVSMSKNIQYLGLSGNNITDTGAKYIAEAIQQNKSLVKLHLHSNNISDEGAKVIANVARNKTFKVLNLSANKISRSAQQEIRKDCCRIPCLDLDCQKILPQIDIKKNIREGNSSSPLSPTTEALIDNLTVPRKTHRRTNTDDSSRKDSLFRKGGKLTETAKVTESSIQHITINQLMHGEVKPSVLKAQMNDISLQITQNQEALSTTSSDTTAYTILQEKIYRLEAEKRSLDAQLHVIEIQQEMEQLRASLAAANSLLEAFQNVTSNDV